jgi:hypothetical protein
MSSYSQMIQIYLNGTKKKEPTGDTAGRLLNYHLAVNSGDSLVIKVLHGLCSIAVDLV